MPAALITGAAIRLGKEIALYLAEKGYDIALHYHQSKAEAKKTAAEIREHKVRCTTYQADLGTADYGDLITRVFSDFPECNVLIHNASLFERAGFLETPETLYDRHMEANLKAPVFLTQAFAKHAKKGRVMTLIDSAITKEQDGYFAYLLSKKALFSFTRMAAHTLAPNITVNAIAPGTLEFSRNASSDYLAKKAASLPMRELASSGEVIGAISYFLDNPTITGQCIFADGGDQLL